MLMLQSLQGGLLTKHLLTFLGLSWPLHQWTSNTYGIFTFAQGNGTSIGRVWTMEHIDI